MNFGNEILLRGEDCKSGKIRNFKKWKNDINNNNLLELFRDVVNNRFFQ